MFSQINNSRKLSPVQKKLIDSWPDDENWYTCEQLNDKLPSVKVQLQTLNSLADKNYLEIDDSDYRHAWNGNNKIELNPKTQVKYRLVPGMAD